MSVLATLLLAGAAVACGGPEPAATPAATTASPPPDPDDEARTTLAARAALAQDHRFAALYHFDPAAGPERNVVATVATDGSWRVDGLTIPVPGRWTARIEVLISDFEMARLEDEVEIRP